MKEAFLAFILGRNRFKQLAIFMFFFPRKPFSEDPGVMGKSAVPAEEHLQQHTVLQDFTGKSWQETLTEHVFLASWNSITLRAV